ncbi:hypothetical protein AB0K60_02165 [Thermopolyspora sp. NPDC052614]
MSDHRMHEFGPIEQDEQGHLSAEHEDTGWTIKAPDEPTPTAPRPTGGE